MLILSDALCVADDMLNFPVHTFLNFNFKTTTARRAQFL